MISVIVPFYNRAAYLEKCVDSILNNTFKDFELLLINDGSTDDGLKIANQLADKDSRIRVIDKKHGGPSDTRNTGLKQAKGEYISFIDSDDYVDECYLQELYTRIINDKLDWVYCAFDVLRNDNLETNKNFVAKNYYGDDIKTSVRDSVFYRTDEHVQLVSPCMSLYKKHIIDDNNLRFDKDIDYGEDTIFNYEYVNKINSFGIINKTLYHVIKHEKSLSVKYLMDPEISDIIHFVDVFVRKIKENNDVITKMKEYYFVDYFFYLFSISIYRMPFRKRWELIEEVKRQSDNNENVSWLLKQIKPFSKKHDFLGNVVKALIVKYKLYHSAYIIWRIIHIFKPYGKIY